jgi:class 3 adenylate cyclase
MVAETRKIAAILAADVVGFSRMTSADEDGTLARLRTLRSELIDPTVASQNGRVFKRTGDGALVEFRSVVELVEAEARRVERSPDPDSMDLYFRGIACMNKGLTAEYISQAETFFDRALALDPANTDALAGKALANCHHVGSFATDDRATYLAAAETAAIGALSRAPNHALAHFALSSAGSRGAILKPLPNASARWRSMATSPTPT